MKRFYMSLLMLFVFAAFSKPCFAEKENKTVVYYFHGHARCVSCRKIESYTREALEEYFYDEISSGEIDYQVVNIDEKENKHYLQYYKLYTKSVVLSKVIDGKEVEYKNLEKVWQYLRNKDKFYEYIKTEAESFLNKDRDL